MKRVARPKDECGAEDEAHGTFACRCGTKDQRAQDGHSAEATCQAGGEAGSEADGGQPQGIEARAEGAGTPGGG